MNKEYIVKLNNILYKFLNYDGIHTKEYMHGMLLTEPISDLLNEVYNKGFDEGKLIKEEFEESIERYRKAKEEGKLDELFPKLTT